ncbi:hypothetical protein [Cryobacterium sp. MDB2-33-2]|uniref:hypothetical protein n=1 Tax=Cryobacterium sp. MDB2-33-2 TaxID=1259179 RepID=UPI00106952F4|nr:hypothetical protein [Cryobacterium sp. MDB2-33-2]TFC06544.1 hypothetical protein E3O59_10235 [Cryobacterium sp. MDB2-33-2]
MHEDFTWAPIRPDHRRRNITTSVAVGLIVALSGALIVLNTDRTRAYDDAQASHTSAVRILDVQRTAAVKQITTATTALAAAKSTLGLHADEVPATDSRAALTTGIQAMDAEISAAWVEAQEADATSLAPVRADDLLSPGEGFRAAATAIGRIRYPLSAALATAVVSLDAPSSSVTAAILTWQSDQALAAAYAAAKASSTALKAAGSAAHATATQARTKAASPVSAPVAPPATQIINQSAAPTRQADAPPQPVVANGPFTLNVRVSGGQPEVDQCNGGVDVNVYVAVVVAEHWFCGGSVFPQTPGTVITLTGIHAGSYRVVGVVLTMNHTTANARDIPTTYDMLFQTCQNNSDLTTTFTALAKIG